jgi:shikimate 5-dehydrogenase
MCGNTVRFEHRELFNEKEHLIEEKKIVEIKRLADRIAFLIVSTDYPEIDIMIEKEKLREKIMEAFPDKAYLYEMIYEPRFQRLFEQFREQGDID